MELYNAEEPYREGVPAAGGGAPQAQDALSDSYVDSIVDDPDGSAPEDSGDSNETTDEEEASADETSADEGTTTPEPEQP